MRTTSSTVGSGKPLRSASAIVAGTETGQHLLKIAGYSRTKADFPTGKYINSQSFRVGGHGWHICYYPNGHTSSCSDCISIFLELDHSVPKGVRARYTFSLLDHAGKPVPRTQRQSDGENIFSYSGWGYASFIKRDELEKSEHLRDDCFTISCDLTVIMEIQAKDIDVADATRPPPAVVVPPPDLHRHLGGLLATGHGADVAFEVDGKTFQAHRVVLAARSPVLHAELSESDSSSDTARIVRIIEDMEAPDFEAFLHYVYTDTLPEMTAAAAMLPDLVAAANRYEMERLRLVCEERMCRFVNARTAAVMLAFAVEHRCRGLKEACLRFFDDTENLREVLKVNGFKHLSETWPPLLQELIAKLVAGLRGSV